MTDSTNKSKPQDNHEIPDSNPPSAEKNDSVERNTTTSRDLGDASAEAIRLLRQSQGGDPAKKAETLHTKSVEEENGNTTNDLQQEAFKAMKLEAERKREAEEKARSEVSARSTFTPDMRLKLESGESGDPIVKIVNEELIVGRADNVTDYLPDIDLTPHGAYRLGLSRRHAIILREGERLVVKDLNSRNGTFVNGAIVAGGNTHVICDGDEVRFGNLAMQVTFLN